MKFLRYLTLVATLAFTTTLIAHEVMEEPTSQVNISIEGDYRYITSNGIPKNHGPFPNSGNPNAISAQLYKFRVPLHPVLAQHISSVTRDEDTGVALNGIPFDPLSIEFWQDGRRAHEPSRTAFTSWNYEAMSNSKMLGLDHNNAHVQPTGAYHYHGLPKTLYQYLSNGKTPPDHMILLGYAADGFPMYGLYGYSVADDSSSQLKLLITSFQLKTGSRPQGAPPGYYDGTFDEDYDYVMSSGDLDQCNGRQGVTPEYPKGTYYYVITNTYPYLPRCFRGTPDPSFAKARPDGFTPKNAAPYEDRIHDESSITKAIDRSFDDMQESWNHGDLKKFLESYDQSDSTLYVSSAGILHGYNSIAKRFYTHYSTQGKLGQLKFSDISIQILSNNYVSAVGQWHLNRPKEGDISGAFSLLYKETINGWKIVLDHTS